MGYKTDVAGYVQLAMQMLGQDDGLAPAHTYVSVDVGSSTYDPVTRTVTRVDVDYTSVPMVLAGLTDDEAADGTMPAVVTMKILIAANDLGAEPKLQDRVHLVNGIKYLVEKIKGVPGDGLHILFVSQTE